MKKLLLFSVFSLILSCSYASVTLTDTVRNVCYGASGGSVSLVAAGGTAPYQYKLGTGSYQSSSVFTGLAAGTYTFYTQDAVGATASISATLTQSTQINITGTVNTGTSTISTVVTGGSAPYKYYWPGWYTQPASTYNDTSSYITGGSYPTSLFGGSYYVVVTDHNGCTALDSFMVPGTAIMTAHVKSPSCYANPNDDTLVFSGNIQSLRVNAGFQLGFTTTFAFPVSGTGFLSATGEAGSDYTITYHYTTLTPLVIASSVTNTTGGQNNGAITVTPSGGQGGYTYRWSGSTATTASRTGLGAGSYAVTVTEAGGCSTSATINITGPANSLALYLDTVSAGSGQVATVHVKVRNFKKIVSAQGSIQFNTPVATYAGVSQFGLTGLSTASFGTTAISSGTLTFSWSDLSLVGVSLADGTTLFSIQYDVVGSVGQSTPVALTTSPTILEFSDTSLTTIPYTVSPGMITVNSSVTLRGRIHSWTANRGVRSSTVTLGAGTHTTVVTDTSGSYSFVAVAGSADSITPSKNNDTLRANGVTTLDVLMVQRYILGTYALTGPYKLIAADVNSSGSVTTLDYTLMQALILGNTTTFPGSKLWTFVPSTYTFSTPQSPWGFPTSRLYTSAAALTGQDFIGIKLGDVSGDWNPLAAKTQSADSLILYAPQATVLPGQDISVPVRARGFKGISGMQFTLTWDSTQLSYTGIDSTSPLLANYGTTMTSSGILGVQWNDPNGTATTVSNDSTLFRVKFHVIGSLGDSSYVSFDSSAVTVQFIDSNLNVIEPFFRSGKISVAQPSGIGSVTADAISLYPNPATSQLVVDLGAAATGDAEITIRDASGKNVYTRTMTNQRTETLSVKDWAEGIYMAQVKYSGMVKMLKVVILHP